MLARIAYNSSLGGQRAVALSRRLVSRPLTDKVAKMFGRIHFRGTMFLLFISLAIVGLSSLLTGCSEPENQGVSAKTSKFEVDAPADKAAKKSDESKTPADAARELAQSAPDAPIPPTKPSRPPVSENAKTKATPPAADPGKVGKATPDKPASQLPARLDPDKLPDGTPEELLAIIGELEQREPRGANQQDMLADFRATLLMRIRLAEKVLGSKATDEQRLQAAKGKLGALVDSVRIGFPSAATDLQAYCKELATDRTKAIARLGHTTMFQLDLGAVETGVADSAKRVFSTLKQVLAEDGPQDEFFGPAQQCVQALQRGGFSEEAAEACKLVADTYLKSTNAKVVDAAKQLKEISIIFEADIPGKMTALQKGDAKAAESLRDALKKLLANKPGAAFLQLVGEATQQLEMQQQYKIAEEIFAATLAAYKDNPDEQLAKQAEADATQAMKRLSLVGKPFTVEGNSLDGTAFDWSKYKGKVVLIDFWATWCGPCLREIPNIRVNFEKYHEMGFEVIGVNLDEDRSQLDQFFAVQKLPWPTVVSADPKSVGFEMPLAEKCGVAAIPFVILIGRDGKVLDLHVRGERLEEKLAEIFDGVKPPANGDKTEKPKAKEEKSSRFQRPARKANGFVGAEEKADARAKDAAVPAAANAKRATAANDTAAKGDEKKTEPALPEPEGNPYSPREDLTTAELVDFIFNMQEKPKSIQSRPGFAEAIVEAADRVLAGKASEKQQLIATLAKCETLHKKACAGSDDADKQLMAFVAMLKDDMRPKVADEVRFLQLERQVLDAEKAPLEKVPDVLAELKTYCEKQKLNARHLRMASGSVQAVNRLEDGDKREKYFAELGGLFAKSESKELARYGKKLTKKPELDQSELVGKPLEIAGTTVDGAEFDWKSYRGKVVLVDFWATWCGPCIREMPNVHKLYEKYHKKGFDVVGISVDADEDALATFLQQNSIPWTTIAGEESQKMATKYGVRGIPSMMLVDREGKVLAVAHNTNGFAEKIEKLFGEGK